jgi:hypothetical protein
MALISNASRSAGFFFFVGRRKDARVESIRMVAARVETRRFY